MQVMRQTILFHKVANHRQTQRTVRQLWTAMQQGLGINILRIVQDFCHRTLLTNLAITHYNDLIRNFTNYRQVMTDE